MPEYTQGIPNYFGQLIAILTTEELLALKVRCSRTHPKLSEVLLDEIEERSLPPTYP